MFDSALWHTASAVRTAVANQPLWLFLGLLGIFTTVDSLGLTGRRRLAPGDLPIVAAGAMVIATFGVLVVWYVSIPQYYDHAEPTVAAIGWLFNLGRPIYHAVDSAERYSHIWGPWTFVIQGWFLALAGPGISVSKAPGAIAAFVGLIALFLLTRRETSTRSAIALTALFTLLALAFRNVAFWARPDSYLWCSATLSLAAANARARTGAIIGVGVAATLMLNLKVTGPVYALPAFALVATRFGFGSAIMAAGVTALAAPVPFLVFPGVSFENFLVWLRLSASNGLKWHIFFENVPWALFFLAPVFAFALMPPGSDRARERRWFTAAIVAATALISIAASKPGAGSAHLLPLVPSVVYGLARYLVRSAGPHPSRLLRTGAMAFTATALVIAAAQQSFFVRGVTLTHGAEIAADVNATLAANPTTTIGMGISTEHEPYTYFRPLLVFQTGHYLIDAPAVQEEQLSGLALPDRTLASLQACQPAIWLLPKNGGEPFGTRSVYRWANHDPIFSEDFRRAFAESYAHSGDTTFFEVWSCR